MRKSLFYIIIIFQAITLFSCNRKVCPAYHSSFQPKQGTANEFFAYFKPAGGEGEVDESSDDIYTDDTFLAPSFEEDTVLIAKIDTFKNSYGLLVFANGEEPMDTPLMKSASKNKHGVTRKSNFFNRIFSNDTKRRNTNYPKVIKTKNPRPFKTEDVEGDSTHQLIQKKAPPKNADQYYYELEFGSMDAVDSLSNTDEVQQAGDSIATEQTEEELVETNKKDKKKKKRKEKKNKRKKKKRNKSDAALDDEDFTELIGEDNLKEKKKKKKKKAEKETIPDETSLDDTK